MSIWRWPGLLTPLPEEHRCSLGEGNTPLIPSRRIGPAVGLRHLSFKLEISNPTGSYKDRFAAAAISHMRAAGQSVCVATSSGNTGSALAAYCAAWGIACRIAIVEKAPAAKLLQMFAYGAQLYRVRGFGVDPDVTAATFDALRDAGAMAGAALQISAFKHSPLGMEGVQTVAYELADQQAHSRHVFVPAGGGGLTLAIARGFQRLVDSGRLEASPAVHCVQPEGNDTIATPLRSGSDVARAVSCSTDITGLQVPSVIDGNQVIVACRASGGTGHLVSDEVVFRVQRELASREGIFCEPAGAVAVAAALSAFRSGELSADDRVVCMVTGSGFKDLVAAERLAGNATCPTIDWEQVAGRFDPGATGTDASPTQGKGRESVKSVG